MATRQGCCRKSAIDTLRKARLAGIHVKDGGLQCRRPARLVVQRTDRLRQPLCASNVEILLWGRQKTNWAWRFELGPQGPCRRLPARRRRAASREAAGARRCVRLPRRRYGRSHRARARTGRPFDAVGVPLTAQGSSDKAMPVRARGKYSCRRKIMQRSICGERLWEIALPMALVNKLRPGSLMVSGMERSGA